MLDKLFGRLWVMPEIIWTKFLIGVWVKPWGRDSVVTDIEIHLLCLTVIFRWWRKL